MPSAEAKRQISLLRAEIRRLSAQLDRQSVELNASLAKNANLEAAFAVALAERDKILTSKAWRATRALQQAASACTASLSRFLPVAGERPSTAEPAPREPELPPSSGDEITYEAWVLSYGSLSDDDRRMISARIARLAHRPLISIFISTSGTPEARHQTIKSLDNQLYPAWDLCSDDTTTSTAAFVAFMEPGDQLAEQALFEVAMALDVYPDADVIYSDEDVIDKDGRRRDPVLKPAFSIDLLLGTNMIGRLAIFRRSLLEALGLSIGDMKREQEHELALGAAMGTVSTRIRHIPAILYHRRVPEKSTKQAAGPDQARSASRTATDVPGLPDVRRIPIAGHSDWSRVIWPLPDPLPRVSLIVPTRDRADLLARCIVGLLYRTDYPDLEVIIIDNDSQEVGTFSLFEMLRRDLRVRVIPVSGSFNFSALNNAGVRAATGTIIVMVNNDIDVIDDGWLREMVSHAIRPDVGAVGAKLIYGDNHIQHAGIVLGVGCHDGGPGVAGHFGHSAEGDDDGYLGQFVLTREVSAVTGACLALRHEVWAAVGGLNETDLPVAYNDVDLCLRIRACGWRIIWTPFAELYHLESASRARDETPDQHARAAREALYMRDQWGPVLDDDPFYNPNFDRSSHLFKLACPPRWQRPWLDKPAAAADLTS